MFVLGINSAYHESSACLLNDGMIIAAAEEERFTRKKHGKEPKLDNADELPLSAIRYCLHTAGIDLCEVQYIGFSYNPDKRLNGLQVLRESKDFVDFVVEDSWGTPRGEEIFFNHLCLVPQKLREMGFVGEFLTIDHHLCHAASAFFLSPFSESAVLTVDGIGEIDSTHFAYGKGKELTPLQTIRYPATVGLLWEKFAKFLGFSEYDAAKVMGLASYGNPDRYSEHFKKLVNLLPEGRFQMDNTTLRFRVEDYQPLESLFGIPKRMYGQALTDAHQDVAAALQRVTEEVLLYMVCYLHEQISSENLCLAGGVALNCTANAVVHERSPFTNLYVQPAAHDGGTAIGAAFVVWSRHSTTAQKSVMEHAYVGPSFSNEEIEAALQEKKLPYKYVSNIEKTVAELLSQQKIVGWFQGRMEIGPRALGNRSLLADPRDPNMREILNSRIKHREAFRPFAPSVLEEEAQKWFVIPKTTIASDFMLMAYRTQAWARELIPAVVHVDGTSRLQTVRREHNARYHKLISEFYALTGVPLVLNTSFNDNEPIVCTPLNAIDTFLKTRMDYLAIGDYLICQNA